jgi:hypothetical protein
MSKQVGTRWKRPKLPFANSIGRQHRAFVTHPHCRNQSLVQHGHVFYVERHGCSYVDGPEGLNLLNGRPPRPYWNVEYAREPYEVRTQAFELDSSVRRDRNLLRASGDRHIRNVNSIITV